MNKKICTFLISLFVSGSFVLASCTLDHFDFSTDADSSDSTEQATPKKAPIAYCNKFDHNGFRGLLTVHYDVNQDRLTKNATWLHLWDIPYEVEQTGNFAQFHRFRISDNKEVFHESPLEADVIKHSNFTQVIIITTINTTLLSDLGGITMDQLLNRYSFLLKDTAGWHGIALSVFNPQNKPIKTVKVLVPPFESNPKTYVANNDHESLLLKLHPFGELSLSNENDDRTFYEKALDNCQDSPIPLQLPDLDEFDFNKETTAPIDLPDLNALFK